MKVLIGALAHESNDFCPKCTTRAMFEYYEGQAALDHLPVTDIFEDAGIEMVPAVYACAQSYGPVETETYLYFEERILNAARQQPEIDGVWMFLHGAMNVAAIGSGEYRLASRLREVLGERCVIAFGMDLHGNIEPNFASAANIFRCYHTAPHTDQVDTYRRTARLLVAYLQNGYHCRTQLRKIPMIFPGEKAATTVEPFKSIIATMKDWEENDPAIACASCYIGFAWCDAVRTSSAVAVTPSAPQYETYCAAKADELAALVFSKRREFGFEMLALPPAETALHSLYKMEAPCCVTDMGDNPTAGTTGGSTVLLREYLAVNDQKKRVLILGLLDKSAFDACLLHQEGDVFKLSIGMDIDAVSKPVTITATYKSCHDVFGYDIPSNPPIKRCRGILVTTGPIDILITDLAYAFTQKVNFESCCLDVSQYDVFVTKFGYIFPELRELGKSYIMSNTPGESYQMVEELDYKHIIRPIYPLDAI